MRWLACPIFQIVCEKINFGSKIRVPPRQNEKFLISPQIHFSLISAQTFLKVSSPPGQTYSKILISPKNFGEKWHYVLVTSFSDGQLTHWDAHDRNFDCTDGDVACGFTAIYSNGKIIILNPEKGHTFFITIYIIAITLIDKWAI